MSGIIPHVEPLESRDLAAVNPLRPPFRLPPGVVRVYAEPLLRDAAAEAIQTWSPLMRTTVLDLTTDPFRAAVVIVEGDVQGGQGQFYPARGSHPRYIPGGVVTIDRVEIPTELLGKATAHELGHLLGLIHSPDPASLMYGSHETWESFAASGVTAQDAVDLWRLYGKRRR